ncbi:unknown [Clostridium sp. CAG:575]|nr:unknown [Clostridium sp. CAG:575]
MSKSGIVNVRMVITEEKILSNIEKVQKMINPNSKKQIIQLEEDAYFKDLIESIKTYLIEYPKKKNFPSSVYKAAYGLVEYATNQFEENTKKIEELIRQREQNISLAGQLKELINCVANKEENWKEQIKKAEGTFDEDIIDTLNILGKCKTDKSQNYQDSMKLLNARVNNLESNLHIEIDMERIEDRSKALSYIGIEVADALKTIPTPIEEPEKIEVQEKEEEIVEQEQIQQQYIEETTFETKPSLWQRIKNSKVVRAIRYITKIRIVIQYPEALPEGRGENN